MYLANTRPDSCLVMNVLRQSMSQPRQTHLIAVKHILRYAPSVNLSLQDMQIQIEQRVQWTGREHWLLSYHKSCHGFLVQQETKSLWP
jgi:hypothetical protein